MAWKTIEQRQAYQREYMRRYRAKRRAEKGEMKEQPKNANFNVGHVPKHEPEEKLDMNSKEVKALLQLAKKSLKQDEDMGESGEQKFIKYMEKAVELAPMAQEIVKNLVAGFQSAAFQAQAAQAPQGTTLRAPEGWEYMSGLQRLSKKYSNPEWYAAGERYETLKATGGAQYITPVNTGYVDPNYRQPSAPVNSEPKNLRDLKNKYPEPPLVEDSTPSAPVEHINEKPSFVKEAQEKRKEEKPAENVSPELLNAMREDNNKYIELAFNWMAGLKLEEFKDYVNNVDKWKAKISMAKFLLPTQTKEMLKNTPAEEFIDVFKQRAKDKYDYLRKEKKLKELERLFEEMKEGL